MDTEITKSPDLTGQVVGQYHITNRLGRGGMADVYKALHTELKVHRAIKFIRPEFATSEDFRIRFQKEAQAVAQLEHPNIVRIHDFGNSDSQYYMVMQFIEGHDLKHELAQSKILPTDQAIDLTVAVAEALTYAHERDLIHRDIKPENILLDEKGAPILVDFGIAKLLTENTALTQTGVGIGTPDYMAPEQAQGHSITPATDIYALAIVLYEMVTGTKPYSADTPIAVMLKAISDPLPLPRTINPAISEELQAVILKATAKDPMQRYQNAEEFAQDLRAVRTGTQPIIARAAPVAAELKPAPITAAAEPSARTSVANKIARGLSWLGALTLAVGFGGLYWWLNNDKDQSPPAVTAAELAETETAKTPSTIPSTNAATKRTQAPSAPSSKSIAFQPASMPDAGEIFAYRNTLAAGQAIEHELELVEGDALYLKVHSTSNTTDFKLVPPEGGKPVFNSSNDSGPAFVNQTGTHRMSIVARNSKESAIDTQLFRLGEATLNGGAISFGDYQSATTQWPGQRLNYTADLVAGESVYLEVLRAKTTTDFSLRRLDDRKNLFSSTSNKGPIKIDSTGTHQFFADPRNDRLADYEFILHKLNPAVISGGNYQPNTYAEATTSQPGQIVRYDVDFDEGDYVYFELLRSESTTDFVLTEPEGRANAFSTSSNMGPVQLKHSGTYTLTADPRSNKLGDYDIRLYKLSPGVIQGGDITHNEVISGATTQPGQIAQYSLDIAVPAQVNLEVVGQSMTVDYRLRSADGRSTILSSSRNAEGKGVTPGKYIFTADPRSKAVGSYEFLIRVQPDSS